MYNAVKLYLSREYPRQFRINSLLLSFICAEFAQYCVTHMNDMCADSAITQLTLQKCNEVAQITYLV